MGTTAAQLLDRLNDAMPYPEAFTEIANNHPKALIQATAQSVREMADAIGVTGQIHALKHNTYENVPEQLRFALQQYHSEQNTGSSIPYGPKNTPNGQMLS